MELLKNKKVLFVLLFVGLYSPSSFSSDFETEAKKVYGYNLEKREDSEQPQPTTGAAASINLINTEIETPQEEVTQVNLDFGATETNHYPLQSSINYSNVTQDLSIPALDREQEKICPVRPISEWNKPAPEQMVCVSWLNSQNELKQKQVNPPPTDPALALPGQIITKTYKPDPEPTRTH